ncbi:MAG: RNA polymerase sigma factor [Bacteroidetes bacterium]|nr:RNA polymerase sigma factor [Bacteroidota bacterium]
MLPASDIKQEFTTVLQAHERLVYKVCNIYASGAEDIKDLFQEIVLQAWKAYPNFRREASVSTWLYRVALNTAITHKRKQKKDNTITVGDFPEMNIADKMQQPYAEEYKILMSLISSLPPLEKALVLLYLEDRPHQEIADIIGISLSNVGTKLGRIKEKLKKQAQPFITS